MDFHLENGLRLHTEPEHASLYSWAINEINAHNQKIGRDQIPWVWTLNFTATSCALRDSFDIKSKLSSDEDAPTVIDSTQRQVIWVKLRPGSPRDDDNYFRQTTFSMFGTDRAIKSFYLEIQPIAQPADHETCKAWGTVSYTTDIDFRDETTEDSIFFYLFVKPETFARYAANISSGLVDEMILSVRSVAGFYSDWSPSTSTNSIKVLTRGDEHKVALPPGLQFEPPRLGDVGAAQLIISRKLDFAQPSHEAETIDMPDRLTEASVATVTRDSPAVDTRTLQLLISLKRAAWSVMALLALIFVATLSGR